MIRKKSRGGISCRTAIISRALRILELLIPSYFSVELYNGSLGWSRAATNLSAAISLDRGRDGIQFRSLAAVLTLSAGAPGASARKLLQ